MTLGQTGTVRQSAPSLGERRETRKREGGREEGGSEGGSDLWTRYPNTAVTALPGHLDWALPAVRVQYAKMRKSKMLSETRKEFLPQTGTMPDATPILLILAAAHCAAGFSLGGFAAGGRAPARATAALASVLPRRRARRSPAGSLRAQEEAAGAKRAHLARRDAIGAAVLWGGSLCVSGAQADDGAPAASKLYNLPTSYGCKVPAGPSPPRD